MSKQDDVWVRANNRDIHRRLASGVKLPSPYPEGVNGHDQAVEAVWVDSVTLDHGDWTAAEPLTEAELRHRTCGYLVWANDDAVCIAASRNDQEDQEPRYAQAVVIPRTALVSLWGMRVDGPEMDREPGAERK